MWRHRVLLLAWIVLSACKAAEYKAPPVEPLPDDVVKAAEGRIAALQARSTELNAMEAQIDPAAWVPRPDLGACSVVLGDAPFALEIVKDDSVIPRPGEVLSGKVHRALSELSTELHKASPTAEMREEQIAAIRARIDAPAPEVAVVFVVDDWHDASFDLHSTSTDFEPGSVTGTAYLWSAKAGTVVCVADVMATSSEALSVPVQNTSVDSYYGRNDRSEIRSALDADLRRRLESAIASSFEHAAGPPEDVKARRPGGSGTAARR